MNPFIRNHQYNVIKKQIKHLQHTYKTVSDKKIIEAVSYSCLTKIIDAFEGLTDEQEQMLMQMAELTTTESLEQYRLSFEPYLMAFPEYSSKHMSKIFPKVKKLKAPDSASVDFNKLTYLGWQDVAQNKQFIVYPLNGQLRGVEGRFTPSGKGVCFLCNRHEDVALFTAITKSRPAHVSPDYYKAIGNYICTDSEACNQQITNVQSLEQFLNNVLK